VGDVADTPGRSLFVRLKGRDRGKGAAGKWTDAATGQHGDLLDLIKLNRGLATLDAVLDEARAFLTLPRAERGEVRSSPAPPGSSEAARRLFAISKPIVGTHAEAYLRKRGITALSGADALRFHPRCYYRPGARQRTETWPALIAAVTDLSGTLTGVQRTWLDPSGEGKAPIETPRRAMGCLLGNAVRFGSMHDVVAVGEGIETMLSLKCALPKLPMAAALSANHLAAVIFPASLRRLYIALDRDPAGSRVLSRLTSRTQESGIEAIALMPTFSDFNDDLRRLGLEGLRSGLQEQIAPEDVARFFPAAE
jgi:hypothetical protein